MAKRLALLATALAAACLLAVTLNSQQKNPIPSELLVGHLHHRGNVVRGRQQRQMLKFKENLPDKSPFEKFDDGFKAPAWTTGLKDTNVFDDGKEEESKPYKKNVAEESVLDEIPDEYPFNELKGGHTWHEWKGESVMQALGESNVLDDGTTKDESFELGEHSLGRPFHKFVPDKNPLGDLDDKEHVWGATAKSIPEVNVYDGISPNTGYNAEKA